jgi:hypothetical protein
VRHPTIFPSGRRTPIRPARSARSKGSRSPEAAIGALWRGPPQGAKVANRGCCMGADLNAFEFYLAFYGLLLGLSVAEVASGFLNAIDARRKVKLGWLTPSLAIFVFFDITSLWIYVWGIRDSIEVNWATMFGGLIVALTYYIAAGLVFPRNIAEWQDLREHYWRNKRLILAGIIGANVVISAATIALHPPVLDFSYWFGVVTYWPMLVVLPFSKSDKLDLTLLWIIIAGYLANVVLPTSWILQ